MEKISKENCRRIFYEMIISNQKTIVWSKMNSNTIQGFLGQVQDLMGEPEVKEEVRDFLYNICESKETYYLSLPAGKLGNASVVTKQMQFNSVSDFEDYLKKDEYSDFTLIINSILYWKEFEMFEQKRNGRYIVRFALLHKDRVTC
jgi:hypothetical protein